MNSERGESEREYVVSDGALLLDDDVFHQFYFLARRSDQGTIPVVIPRRNTQVVLKVTNQGNENVTIGTKTISAQHLVFSDPSGQVRDVWVDDKGRVLKVEIPARKLVALRDDPPT